MYQVYEAMHAIGKLINSQRGVWATPSFWRAGVSFSQVVSCAFAIALSTVSHPTLAQRAFKTNGEGKQAVDALEG